MNQNPYESLIFTDALAARLLEKLAAAAREDLLATLPPKELAQLHTAVERHDWRHRYCECCPHTL